MKKKIVKTYALLFALILTITAAGSSLAITGDPWDFSNPVYYPGSARTTTVAHVRKEPYALADLLGNVEKGEWVTILGSTGNWYIVPWGSGIGYMYKGYFEDQTQPQNPGAEIPVKATANVNVRSGPGTSYSTVGSLQKGESAIKTGTSGNWTMIRYFGQTAYVYSKYLTDGTTPGTAPASGTMEATADVNVRKGPGTQYAKDGWLNRGDRVTKLGTSGSWTMIEWKGGTAYVYSKYLKAPSAVPVSVTKFANRFTYVYSSPGASYAVGSLQVNDPVTATGIFSGSWTQIKWGAGTAYVPTENLSSVPFGNTLTATIRRALVNTAAYQGAGTSTGFVKLISQNELVSCTGVAVDNWMQVIVSNGYAFVAANCLSDPLYSYPVTAPNAAIMRAKADTIVYPAPVAAYGTAIALLKAGDQVVRIAKLNDGWAQIKLVNGLIGYVPDSALE